MSRAQQLIPLSFAFLVFLSTFSPICSNLNAQQEKETEIKKLDPDSVEAKLLEVKKLDQYRAFAASTKMVLIPGGIYKGKQIDSFYMDVDLVNVGQYKAAVRMGVCPQPPKTDDISDSWKLGNNKRAQNNVNWFAAKAFLDWTGKKFPTEDQWEWVARGREKGYQYPWGNSSPTKKDACWMRYFPEKDICLGPGLVGVDRATSRDGVHDMAGCLWQWTRSRTGEGKALVILKGGSWYNDNPEKLKVSARGIANPYHNSHDSDGFRGVMSVKEYQQLQKFLKSNSPVNKLNLSPGRFAKGNEIPNK